MKSLIFLLAAALLSGCATPQPRDPAAGRLISRTTVPYEMAPLDKARVTLPGDRSVTIEVSGDGTATLAGTTRNVAGWSDEKFRTWIRSVHPQARSITIEEFRPNKISVLGEVYHQLHADLTDGPMRLMDALAGANGFTPLANKRRVRLIRQNGGVIEVYEFDLRESLRGQDMGQNILLKPGDLITVPRNFL